MFSAQAAAALFFLAAMGGEGVPDQQLAKTRAGDFTIQLFSHEKACFASFSRSDSGTATTILLPLQAPCDFNREENGAVRMLKRSDGYFVAVFHSRVISADPRACDTAIQAIRIDSYGPDLAPKLERVAGCPPFAFDEPLFFSLFDG